MTLSGANEINNVLEELEKIEEIVDSGDLAQAIKRLTIALVRAANALQREIGDAETDIQKLKRTR